MISHNTDVNWNAVITGNLRWLAGPRQKLYDMGNTRCGESLLKCPSIDAEIVYGYKVKKIAHF